MTEREAYIAFNMTEQVGSVKANFLIKEFGTLAKAWEAFPEKISRSGGEVDYEAEIKKAERYGVTILTPIDPDYPESLKSIRSFPLAIYVKGDVSILKKLSISMVGTRKCTDYGRKAAFTLARDLAYAGWVIVSGLALGIDGESHRGALAAKGLTIGVIGSGLDQFYPEENRELGREIVKSGGAVISQFPFGRYADKETFPIRNHIVAALSRGTIAVETPIKGGTMLTATNAAEMGRVVMAVPGPIDSRESRGCHKLIRNGAVLVQNIDDVMEELGQIGEGIRVNNAEGAKVLSKNETKKSSLPPYTLEESLIMRIVDDTGTKIDKVVRESGLSAAKVNSIAMELRLKGRIKFLPGNRIARLA